MGFQNFHGRAKFVIYLSMYYHGKFLEYTYRMVLYLTDIMYLRLLDSRYEELHVQLPDVCFWIHAARLRHLLRLCR